MYFLEQRLLSSWMMMDVPKNSQGSKSYLAFTFVLTELTVDKALKLIIEFPGTDYHHNIINLIEMNSVQIFSQPS